MPPQALKIDSSLGSLEDLLTLSSNITESGGNLIPSITILRQRSLEKVDIPSDTI